MFKILFFILIAICNITFIAKDVHAIEDPLSIPNNKFGVHILFPSELEKAKELVNSSSGDWGYVTIPIQAGDKDMGKWQNFMDSAGKLHLIPIIRIATENYFFDTKVWRKPTYYDVVDFANFLNSLTWPTKNRYVIIFNEVNRADEWGGEVNPGEYANILSFSIETFKQKSEDFFVISAGLDNASSNTEGVSMNPLRFYQMMYASEPNTFIRLDGIASHSYPNPGFRQPPSKRGPMSIETFRYEKSLLDFYSGKNLPVFITETGWSKNEIAENTIAQYILKAFTDVWSDENVVAVTPFLLEAGEGPFEQFSFVRNDGTKTEFYVVLAGHEKIEGKPSLQPLLKQQKERILEASLSEKKFNNIESEKYVFNDLINPSSKAVIKWLLRL